MGFGVKSQIAVDLLEETSPLEIWPGQSDNEKEKIIRAVYRQVLGNTYVMENQRLTVAESLFKRGDITVRELVRRVAKSELYRDLFFHSSTTFRLVELNFKHLLGRAPNSYEELKYHSNLINTEGFEAEIDSYIDSDEYDQAYGDNVVPFYRGYKTQTGQNTLGFTYMFALRQDVSSSDLKRNSADKSSVLSKYAIQEAPAPIVWNFEDSDVSSRSRYRTRATGASKVYRIEVTTKASRNTVNRVPKFRSNNKVYLVPFEQLFEQYQKIHNQGGVIKSVTSVN